MSIHHYRSIWRSITFNTHYDDSGIVDDPAHLVQAAIGEGYTLDSVDISRVSVQDYRELRQFLEGSEPNEAFEGVRAINAAGKITAHNVADLEDRSWALNEAFSVAACRLAAQALTPKGVLPYDFKRASAGGAKPLRFYARPGPGRPVWVGRRAEGFIRPYTWQLIAFDPFAYDQSATNYDLSIFSATQFNGNPVNPGNIYTRPTIVFTFTGTGDVGVLLTNGTTTKVLTLNFAGMAVGQTLTIDVARSTIVRDDGSNQMGRVTGGFVSDLFMNPGPNNIYTSSRLGISGVQIQFRGAYA